MTKEIESSLFSCKFGESMGVLGFARDRCVHSRWDMFGRPGVCWWMMSWGRGLMETSSSASRKSSTVLMLALSKQTDPHMRNAENSLLCIHRASRGCSPFTAILWHSTLQKCFPFVPVNKSREHRQKKERNNCLLSPIQLPIEPIWKKRIQLSFPARCQHHRWHHTARHPATDEALPKKGTANWGPWVPPWQPLPTGFCNMPRGEERGRDHRIRSLLGPRQEL